MSIGNLQFIRTYKLSKSFTPLSNNIIHDTEVSDEALGFTLRLFAKPDDWNLSIEQLAKSRGKSEKTIYRILKELESKNYYAKKQYFFKGEKITSKVYYLISDTKLNPEIVDIFKSGELGKNGQPLFEHALFEQSKIREILLKTIDNTNHYFNTNNLINRESEVSKKMASIFDKYQRDLGIKIDMNKILKWEKELKIESKQIEVRLERWYQALTNPNVKKAITVNIEGLFFKNFTNSRMPKWITDILAEDKAHAKKQAKQAEANKLSELRKILNVPFTQDYQKEELILAIYRTFYTLNLESYPEEKQKALEQIRIAKESKKSEQIKQLLQDFNIDSLPKVMGLRKDIAEMQELVSTDYIFNFLDSEVKAA